MKAAAYEGIEVWNYDIKGSQLGDVIAATEMVPSVDTDELEEQYQTADTAGCDPKTENAEALGISRDTYKSLLYATIFLGSWSPDASTALDEANPVTGVPQTLKILRQAGWQEGIDVETAYERAQSHFSPLKEAVRKLADYLLTTYWKEHRYNASGWVMRNDCGVIFRKSDYEDASTHKIRSKVLAWFLQGAESDKMHRLADLCRKEGIEVMGNEHDGLITASPIPKEIQDEVLKGSDLERKPFEEYKVEVEEEMGEQDVGDLREGVEEENTASENPDEEGANERAKARTDRGAVPLSSGNDYGDKPICVQRRIERKRRVREGEVPDDPREAVAGGFSMQDWKYAQRRPRTQ
jgi:hypothetical protein